MTGVVTADRLSKWYGHVIALNDASFSIPTGVIGLLGPNGAGKSTLLKLIAGELKPSKGRLTVLGGEPWRNTALYQRLGFCPEQDAYPERLTGFEWVSALARLSGFGAAEADRAAIRALEAVGLVDAAQRQIGGYSKGMRQRVKLAQAIVHDPEVLVLDEPLAGMDPVARRQTIQDIRRWGGGGRTVIVSSHVLHEVEVMTANVLLINQGRIVADGDVHQIRELIDDHPHAVHIRAERPRDLAREFAADPGVLQLQFEDDALIVQTERPDAFYAHLTELAADGRLGLVHEVTSPDDNLQAVFKYLVAS
jgi:ABC-2 type transport system ATP-binding protein